jgi:hypothetical protein
MASARKNSSSKNRSVAKRRVTIPRKRLAKRSASAFAICVRNDDYEASLELRKLYPVLEDDFGNQHGMIRVVDESGEDYLFPNEYFVRVSLPQTVEKQLLKIA